MLFNETYNRINHLIPSVRNQNNVSGYWETSNCATYLTRNPKHSAKYVCRIGDVGIVYCTCGHFLRNDAKENKKYIKYTMDLLSIPNYYIKKGDPTGTVTGRSQWTENTTSPIRSRRSA